MRVGGSHWRVAGDGNRQSRLKGRELYVWQKIWPGFSKPHGAAVKEKITQQHGVR